MRKQMFAAAVLTAAFILPSALFCAGTAEGFLNPLRARGYSLIPAPRQVELGAKDVVVDCTWAVESQSGKDDMACRRLLQGAEELHGLRFDGSGNSRIVLSVAPGTVKGTDDPALGEQAYSLEIIPGRIQITGNAPAGLFYGVQSLLQLLRRDSAGRLKAPECTIHDWPALELRFVHWDTKHHQCRIETLKRLIDWHAFFKVNAIAFEIEDKYEYPSHPMIGAPGAYTKAEMIELTRYAAERHIQLVPDLQAPSHMAFALKHKEFAHLRSDGNNYQVCMCDPEAIRLIFDLYQDLIDATPGVKYFLVSTDEVYYAGMCDKCQKKRPYNEANRSQAWVDFVKQAHAFMSERGRRQISWVEYPLLTKDIAQLPPDLINGVMGSDPEFLAEQKKIGMRQLAYSSTQGSEFLFPDHFPLTATGRGSQGRMHEISRTVRDGLAGGLAIPIGSFAAAWDDSGLHEECFHLGWATVTQYAWNPAGVTVEQNVADFMDVFYGPGSPDMTEVYRSLIQGARFFERGWDEVTSTERGPGYGNSWGKGVGTRRTDELLSLPEIPSPGTLDLPAAFGEKYAGLIKEAGRQQLLNDDLLEKLARYSGQVERNRYNLEVYLSIAYLERYFIRTVLTLNEAEEAMLRAYQAAADNKPAEAVGNLTEASRKVGALIAWSDWMWKNLTVTWEKSRFEKGRSVDGRKFVHVLDDVKDHWADRRAGLDYMIAPFQRMDLPGWRVRLNARIKEYAAAHKVPVAGLSEARLED